MTVRPTIAELLGTDDFVGRHVGPSAPEQAHMLDVIGVESLDALLAQTVPESIRMKGALPLPGPRTVDDVLGELRSLAGRNRRRQSLIGQGYYGTHSAPRDPAQCAREPRLVHVVHALPARDQPGTARSPDQLPDDGG